MSVATEATTSSRGTAVLSGPEDVQAAPALRGARIADIDVVRGMALFGVLMCNLAYCFRVPLFAGGSSQKPEGLDEVVSRLEYIFLSNKAMTLFSMLFGAGLTIFFERASARGPGAMSLLARRIFFLLLFGLAHAFLLWNGDILIAYALAGFCSLFFLQKRPWVLGVAIALLTLFPLTGIVWPALQAFADGPHAPGRYDGVVHIYRTGTYFEIVRHRAWEMIHLVPRAYTFYWPGVLRNMLVGILVWRAGVLRNPMAHARVLRWVPLAILPGIGYPMYRWIYVLLYNAAPTARGPWRNFFDEVSAPMVSMGYAAGILLLLHGRTRWRTWLGALAPVGRMAFTNYLTQSIVCTTIFYGYGFGLMGQVGYARAAALGLVIYSTQVVFSAYWLRRFQFGPFEWAWRCLTYGRLQPMRAPALQMNPS